LLRGSWSIHLRILSLALLILSPEKYQRMVFSSSAAGICLDILEIFLIPILHPYPSSPAKKIFLAGFARLYFICQCSKLSKKLVISSMVAIISKRDIYFFSGNKSAKGSCSSVSTLGVDKENSPLFLNLINLFSPFK